MTKMIGEARRWTARTLGAGALALLLGLGGCASTGTGSESFGSRDVLTGEEIRSAEASNLYEVVQRKRPEWLLTKGVADGGGRFSGQTGIVVVQNGTIIGGVQTLRQFSSDGTRRLRYTEDETAAMSTVGGRAGFIEGVIIVELGG